jgi:hypothetical protein
MLLRPIEEITEHLRASESGVSAAEAELFRVARETFTGMRSMSDKLVPVWAAAAKDWDRQARDYRDSIIRLITETVGFADFSRAFLDRNKPQLSPETVRVYEQDLRAFAALASTLQRELQERLAEDARRGQELTNFALSQPGFREGVAQSRQEIEAGKGHLMSGDDLRERKRKRRERSC